MDVGGQILRMPGLIGRPCFGQPTAYLLHWFKRPYWHAKGGQLREARCTLCGVRDACRFVAEARLSSSVELQKARQAFEAAGGESSLNDKTRVIGSAASRWADLLRELIKHGSFTSSNDVFVADHYAAMEAAALQKDRERKVRDRLKARLGRARLGDFDPEVVLAILAHRTNYVALHSVAALHPKPPHYLRQCRDDSRFFDADVLVASAALSFAGGKLNPSSVAHQLHRFGLHTDREINNLRQRVGPTLNRVQRMSRERLEGVAEPMFPPLDIGAVIRAMG